MFLDAKHVLAVHSDGLDEVALVGVQPDSVELALAGLGDLTGQVLDDDGVDQVVQVVARGGKLHAYRDLLACRPDQAGGQLAGGNVPSIAQLAVIRLRVRYERVPFNGDLRAARHPRDRAEVNVIGQLRVRVRKGVHGPDVDVCAAGLDRVVDDRAELVKFIPV